MNAGGGASGPRAFRLVWSLLDPRAYLHAFRLLHFYNYSHVQPRRRATVGRDAAIAPNISMRNGERISIGDRTHVGAYCSLWAGAIDGRIDILEDALLGPEVYITASNYETAPGIPVIGQPRVEKSVKVGRNTWLGARVIVLPGVSIGDGCIVGAGAVVTTDLPAGSIAVGAPARVVAMR
jgi:acetyltransferase-like isoleucine patch superfamily enzyme